uniref:Uncharacterized protein n=1 Tax=Anopheles farauti TaxID=69004 RepID=A0A182QA43_9DIPT
MRSSSSALAWVPSAEKSGSTSFSEKQNRQYDSAFGFGLQWGQIVFVKHCRDQDSNLGYYGHNTRVKWILGHVTQRIADSLAQLLYVPTGTGAAQYVLLPTLRFLRQLLAQHPDLIFESCHLLPVRLFPCVQQPFRLYLSAARSTSAPALAPPMLLPLLGDSNSFARERASSASFSASSVSRRRTFIRSSRPSCSSWAWSSPQLYVGTSCRFVSYSPPPPVDFFSPCSYFPPPERLSRSSPQLAFERRLLHLAFGQLLLQARCPILCGLLVAAQLVDRMLGRIQPLGQHTPFVLAAGERFLQLLQLILSQRERVALVGVVTLQTADLTAQLRFRNGRCL